MFTDKERPLAVVALSDVHHQPLLQKQRRVKIDESQKIDLERSIERTRSNCFWPVHAWRVDLFCRALRFAATCEIPAWESS